MTRERATQDQNQQDQKHPENQENQQQEQVSQDARTIVSLAEGALTLVDRVVAQVCGSFPRHVDRNELRRAGALGLVEAARRWDPSRGVPFEGYAVLRIRGAVLDAARAADWVPRPVRAMARKIDASEQALLGELGRRPTEAEVVERTGVSLDELRRVRTLLVRLAPLALDRSGNGSDEDCSLVDLVVDQHENEPDQQLEYRELLGYLHDAVDLLSDRHRMVILGAFFDGRSSVDLAGELGVTESRVSQLRAEAIAQLRWGISSQYELSGSAAAGSKRSEQYAVAIAQARKWDQRFDEERRVLERTSPESA